MLGRVGSIRKRLIREQFVVSALVCVVSHIEQV
jgi:hypothetical protein